MKDNSNPETTIIHDNPDSNIISRKQINQYQANGFVVVDNIFNQSDINLMSVAVDELISNAQGISESNLIYDLDETHTPENPRIRRIKDPFLNHKTFSKVARNPRLVSALKCLLGPNIRLHGSKINLKPAFDGSSVEWHQDWAFYPHTNDDVLAVGVMLDDMTHQNGPLMMIPGTHTGPTYDHHQDGRFVGAINLKKCTIPLEKAEVLVGNAGACSFHHARTIHGSDTNRSHKNRCLLLYQVTAADAWDLTGMELSDWDAYVNTILAGEPSIEPRIEQNPVRLPYPTAERQGSIYENQSIVRNRYF